jgi:hypothetical protein
VAANHQVKEKLYVSFNSVHKDRSVRLPQHGHRSFCAL